MSIQPLRVGTIILPSSDNAGNSLGPEHRRLRSILGHTFGGFTSTNGQGFWIDPASGDEHAEPVVVYQIAAVWSPALCLQLRTVAARAASFARQKCVYIDTPLTGVEFVPPAANIYEESA